MAQDKREKRECGAFIYNYMGVFNLLIPGKITEVLFNINNVH